MTAMQTHPSSAAAPAAGAIAPRVPAIDLPLIWYQLEDLRTQYERGTAKPVTQLEDVRNAVARLDPHALAGQHPQAEGILMCTLFELARWQATWPVVAGRSVPPASFGYLLMVDGLA